MALRELLAKFGFEVDDGKLKAGAKAAEGFASQVKGIVALVGSAALVNGLKNFVVATQEQADKLNDTAEQLGINAQELQRWQAAAKLSGSSAEEMANSLKFLQKNAADAASGGQEAAGAFKALGVEVTNNGKIRDTSDLLRDVGVNIAKIENPAERTAAVLKIFGRGGLSMGPMFKEGAEGLDGLLAQLDKMGGGFTKDALNAAGDLGDEFDRFEFATRSLKSRLAESLFPILIKIVGTLNSWVSGMARAAKGTSVLQAAIVVLTLGLLHFKAEAIATALRVAIAWAPVILAVGALVVIVDDLLTAFNGGDSIIGRFVKSLPTTNENGSVFALMAEDFRALVAEVNNAPDAMAEVEAIVDGVALNIGRFIVDDIPEALSFLWKDIKDGIASALFGTEETFSGWWAGFKGRVKDAFAAMGSSIAKFGSDMMTGLANSIREGIDKVLESLSELGGSFIKKLRDLFDWHSPPGIAVDLGEDWTSALSTSLAAGADKIKSAAKVNFDAIVPPGGLAAPKVRGESQAGPRSVQITNHVNNTIHAESGNVGLRNAVREGTSFGLSDLSADLAALEAQAGA